MMIVVLVLKKIRNSIYFAYCGGHPNMISIFVILNKQFRKYFISLYRFICAFLTKNHVLLYVVCPFIFLPSSVTVSSWHSWHSYPYLGRGCGIISAQLPLFIQVLIMFTSLLRLSIQLEKALAQFFIILHS